MARVEIVERMGMSWWLEKKKEKNQRNRKTK